jgi:hypothetical protein
MNSVEKPVKMRQLLATDLVAAYSCRGSKRLGLNLTATAEVIRSAHDSLDALKPHLHDPFLEILTIPLHGACRGRQPAHRKHKSSARI